MATVTAEREGNGEQHQKRWKQGGYKTLPFIMANEICDKFATAGFNANLISYLTQQLNMTLVDASNTLTNFGGTTSLTVVLGAFFADSYIGRFWSIVAGSIFYQIGIMGLVLSAVVPSLRPPPCNAPNPDACQRPSGGHLAVLYISKLCMCLGTGGIRVVAFDADQFDQQGAEAWANRKRRYFNDHVGWGWGFGIPAISMFVSIVEFVVAYPLYVRAKPGGSPFTRQAQILAAAFRKRNAAVPEDRNMLYQDKELDALISTKGRFLHTDKLKFLDRAAIVTPGDVSDSGRPKLWRLSTVHRVEELKSVARLLPIWSAGIILAAAGSHNGSFTIMQARTMERRITRNVEIPPATLSIFTTGTTLVSIILYDRVFVPLARRVTGLPSGVTYFQRMGIGLTIAIFGVGAAALVETRHRGTAAAHGLLDTPKAIVPMSVFWLVPLYTIHGIADAFASVGQMEFLYDQSPESMRSTAVALFWLCGSFGSYLSTVLVTVVQRATRGHGDWLQDNINRGRIDNYYWLITFIMVLNLGYLCCFYFYTLKPLELAEAQPGDHRDKEGDELHSPQKNGAGNGVGMA
ncbi:LOW QUALITY PROTEIN: hypothetical protein SETIT_3G243600v2 [Setaria italica]|uniref:Major facilitator superfamily (MFS) profile domain-containing protein n=1 Tax=Setaria italica TaxID=4555 RepID=A0A368QIC8_SETIT|nr:LOW QUALITY PROTEIN: hypothetical protein SETIT_3G243600v2 [Setaria italica]